MTSEDRLWNAFLMVVIGALLLVAGMFFGSEQERRYQCESKGGELVGRSMCIKGAEVIERW